MQVQSLGYQTDLFFPKFEGEIIDRGEYLVILTPSIPNFYWGNYLLFRDAPQEGDFQRWRALFRQEIGARQPYHHMTFGWDTSDGEQGLVAPFLATGFTLSENIVLSTQRVLEPPKFNHDVTVRPLKEDWEWAQALQNQIDCRDEIHELEGYRTFKQNQMARYRKMNSAGLGEWFGAFLENQLVADLGLFCMDGIGRFQQVETAPAYRRMGICGALVYTAAQYGLQKMGAQTLVMLADEHYHAAKIYESAGFMPREKQVGLEWFEEREKA